MLAKRVLVVALLLPLGLLIIYAGGVYFAAFVVLILSLAAWEYSNLFHAGNYLPSGVIVVVGVAGLAAGRYWNGFESAPWLVSLFVLISMTYHLIAYERGRDLSGTDFGITVAGVFYIGWLGAYLISLRELPDGLWWVLLVLPSVWLADTGAYFVGKAVGKRYITPRLSPKKTWEGYLGGILFGTVGGALLAYLLYVLSGNNPAITPIRGALLGFVLAVLTILGDLGESMFKRQFGVKDSSNLLPGHGGIFDRIDSWLWGGVIGYYVILLFTN